MSKCSECTYLNTNNTNLYGKYWCEEKEKYVFLNSESCDKFSYEAARQSYLNDEYNKFLNSGMKFNFSISAILKILKIERSNAFTANINEFITTAVVSNKKLSKIIYELSKNDNYICSCLMNDPMKEKISFDLFFEYIEPINSLIRLKKYEEALNRYIHMINYLKEFYKIDEKTINSNNQLVKSII